MVNQALPNDVLLDLRTKDETPRIDLEPVKLPWTLEWLPVRGMLAGAETVSIVNIHHSKLPLIDVDQEYYARQIGVMAEGGTPRAP